MTTEWLIIAVETVALLLGFCVSMWINIRLHEQLLIARHLKNDAVAQSARFNARNSELEERVRSLRQLLRMQGEEIQDALKEMGRKRS